MDNDKMQARTRTYLLNRDAAMDEKLYEFGKKCLTIHDLAAEFGCSKDTIQTFFRREPGAKALYTQGKREAKRLAAETGRKASRALLESGLEPPLDGETCALCGQVCGQAKGTITMEISELTGAKEKLEALLDEYDERDRLRYLAEGIEGNGWCTREP